MFKAIGERGSWFAVVDGRRIPCAHKYWWKGRSHYLDPGAKPGERQWDEYIEALRQGKEAILTNDDLLPNGTFKRTGYIALFEIDDIRITNEGLEFGFKKKITSLK